MKRDESVYLAHILDAVRRVEAYTNGVTEDAFYANTLIQDAVIRQLEIIGEAVKHVSAALRKTHSQIPWQDIAGTRDILTHRYFSVSLDEVRLMATRDILPLKVEVPKMLDEIAGK
jgi:uncharacterized protein with HEPN domain